MANVLSLFSYDAWFQDRCDFLHLLKSVEDNAWDGWKVDADEPTDMSNIRIPKKITPAVNFTPIHNKRKGGGV